MMQARRRLHGRKTDQLHQVVLHHVTQRADAIVELDPPANAQVLSNRDLHVIHGAAPP